MITALAIFVSSAYADSTDVPQWAQEKKPVKVAYYLGVGTSFPLGDLADSWKQGFHGYGRLDFSLSPKLSVWAGADYNFFALEDAVDTSAEGGTFSAINLSGDLKINLGTLSQRINPYLFFGVGLAIQSISDYSYRVYGDTLITHRTVTYPTESNALIEIGGGLEYKALFIQGRYVSMWSDKKMRSFIPVTAGVKF